MSEAPDSTVSETRVSPVRQGSSRAPDDRSVVTLEPPAYARNGVTILSGPPPSFTPSSSRQARSPVQHASPDQLSYSQARLFADLPPTPRTRALSLGASSQSNYPHQHASPTMGGPSTLRFPQDRSTSNPQISMTQPNADSTSHANLPRRYNYLVERNENTIRGVWFIDTAIAVPEALCPPPSDFNGVWNEMDKKSIKAREKEKRKREGGGWGRKKVIDTTPPKPLANEGVRPNLMLASKDGSIQGEVNVISGDAGVRMVVIVAESKDGSVKLSVNAAPEQPLRIFAISMDGSVRVRIPPKFEGAISMTALDGTVHISEGIKARLMTFSWTNKSIRCYLGDWQAANFGGPSPFLSDSVSSSSTQAASPPISTHPPEHAFGTWTGPLIHLYSREGSVHISYLGEDTSGIFSKAMRSIKNGILGTGGENEEKQDWVDVSGHDTTLPRSEEMQGYRRPPTEVLEHLRERYPKDPRVAYFAESPDQAQPEREYVPRLSEDEMGVQDWRANRGDPWLDEREPGPSRVPQYGFRSSSPEWPRDHKGSR